MEWIDSFLGMITNFIPIEIKDCSRYVYTIENSTKILMKTL